MKSGTIRQTKVDAAEEVYELLAGWAFDRRGWKREHVWKSIDTESVVDLGGNCEIDYRDGEVRMRFALLDIEGVGSTKDEAWARLLERLGETTRESKEKRLLFSEWASSHFVKRPKTT